MCVDSGNGIVMSLATYGTASPAMCCRVDPMLLNGGQSIATTEPMQRLDRCAAQLSDFKSCVVEQALGGPYL